MLHQRPTWVPARAIRPLDASAVAIEHGRVLVDTTPRMRRTAFEPEHIARAGSNG